MSKLVKQVIDLVSEEDYLGAKDILTKVILNKSRHLNALKLTLGCVLMHTKDFQEAIHVLAAIDNADKNRDVLERLAYCFYHIGDYDESLACFKILCNDEIETPHLHMCGILYCLKGDFSSAISSFDSVLNLDPASGATRISLASLLAACPDEELIDGERALSILTNGRSKGQEFSWEYHAALAVVFAELDNWDEAEAEAKHALNICPASQRTTRGERLASVQNREKVRFVVSEVIRLITPPSGIVDE